MTPDQRKQLLDLFGAASGDAFTENQHAHLQNALRSSADARALWFLHQDVELGLRTQLHAEPISKLPLWFRWRPISAAAAGLMLGLFGSSALFAHLSPGPIKVIPLLRDGFDSGPAPRVEGMPNQPGFWGGDFTRTTGPVPGVNPLSGGHMLQFLRADYEGYAGPPAYNSDLHRLVDLRGLASEIADGKAWVTLEASFWSAPVEGPFRFVCGAALRSLYDLPQQGGEKEMWGHISREERVRAKGGTDELAHFSPASTRREAELPRDGSRWQRLRTQLQVSPGTRYVLLSLHVSEANALREKAGTRGFLFPGQYVDNVQVSLSRGGPLP